MAILKNALVQGAARVIGKLYCTEADILDMSTTNITATGAVSAATLSSSGNATIGGTLGVTGAATFSSTLNATGNITSTSNLYANGGQLYLNSKLAADGKTTANTLVINGSGNFSSGTYVKNLLKSDTLDATTLSATTLSASSASFSGDVTVNGVLNSNEMQTNIVKAVGGQLYVSPTYVAGSSATIACTNSDTSYVWFTISDSAITGLAYGGANWYSGSKIMFTGVVRANLSGQPDIVFASSPGELTANMNASNNKLQIKVKYDKASTYFSSAGTNLTWSDMSVMMYQINNSGTLYPIGVYIKAYGNDNKNSYIDIYGGTSATTSARLGLLDGVPAMANGTTPTGWGIYTNHGYFDGTIVSNSGQIGNFTLGTDLRSGTWGTSGSVLVSPGYSPSNAESVSIGGSPATGNTWAFTSGNNFGVTTSGSLYASSANISGTISAGANSTIGPWSVTATSIYKGNATMGSATTGAAYFGDNGLSITNKFKVTAAGLLSATGADISGEIHASSGSTFGDLDKTYIAISGDAMDLYNGTRQMLHFGYGLLVGESGNQYSPFYTLGLRREDSVIGGFSLCEGSGNTASGVLSHAEGYMTTASGRASHSEGYGEYSYGVSTAGKASGAYSHSEGFATIASGNNSHSEGARTTASGSDAHAEGSNTTAFGTGSHAEGLFTGVYIHNLAPNNDSYSHAEGYYSEVYGKFSHAEGGYTTVGGDYAHASGYYSVANRDYQTVIGKYNYCDEYDGDTQILTPKDWDSGDYAFVIGNGTEDARSNALTVSWSGNLITAGTITSGGNLSVTGTITSTGAISAGSMTSNNSPVITQANIVNNLTSTSTTAPLSAAQGKALNDKISPIGTYIYASGNVTVAANSDAWSNVATINLPAGTWVITGDGHWASNSSDAVKKIKVVTSKNSAYSTQQVRTQWYTETNVTLLVVTTEAGTATVQASSNVALSVNGIIRATRIK